VQSTTF